MQSKGVFKLIMLLTIKNESQIRGFVFKFIYSNSRLILWKFHLFHRVSLIISPCCSFESSKKKKQLLNIRHKKGERRTNIPGQNLKLLERTIKEYICLQ
jgi:hypothetical protein